MTHEPKTWTDKEIIDLMVEEAQAYREGRGKLALLECYEMMECVLSVMDNQGLIEKTP